MSEKIVEQKSVALYASESSYTQAYLRLLKARMVLHAPLRSFARMLGQQFLRGVLKGLLFALLLTIGLSLILVVLSQGDLPQWLDQLLLKLEHLLKGGKHVHIS